MTAGSLVRPPFPAFAAAIAVAATAVFLAPAAPVAADPKPDKVFESEGRKFRVQTLLKRDDVVWGFDFLSSAKIVFTERGGRIGVYELGAKSATDVKGAPKVWEHGQGGLLDVRVHPTDKTKLYLTYSEPSGRGATTTLASANLRGNELKDFKILLSTDAGNRNEIHFGSRIEFDGGGHVFFTVGDRNDRPRVQDLSHHNGKILRLNEDGSVPKDNPFVGRKGAKPEIWTLGHRSPQGLVRQPATGDLWMAEMGPRGGDEVNLVKKGANYGWPVVTYGREYHGPKIGEGTSKPGMEDPVAFWVPSISPSAMTFYDGDKFPAWKGDAFLGNLSGEHLRRLVIDGGKVVKQEELLAGEGWRVRNVRPGPDGNLYLSTDDGWIARLVPVE